MTASTTTPETLFQGFRGFRWTVCALLFVAATINYMDRQVLGILAPTLEKSLGWNEIEYSHIVMAFQAAYALGLLVFGRLVDRIGTRHGYAISIIAWSLAAMAHALAHGVFGFGMARFALGFGEGGNFPAAVKTVSEWFPRRERALATGLFNSGSNVGAILAPLCVPWLTLNYGWRMAFIVLGAIGFLWLILWYWLYATPALSRRVSAAELAHIASDPREPSTEEISWSALLRYRQTWAFVVGISFTVPIWWFFLYWLPKFMHQQYGLDLANLGPPLVAIYSMTSVGSIGGGWLSSETRLVGQREPQDGSAHLRSLRGTGDFCRARLPSLAGHLRHRPGCCVPPGLGGQFVHDGFGHVPEAGGRNGRGNRNHVWLGGFDGIRAIDWFHFADDW